MFHNLILADEINRAPAKVQSALLEAMAERQITVGAESYPLPPLFLVMATQNPIEQEGTYPLPEAQLDRFLLHVRIVYPDAGSERAILELAREEARTLESGAMAKPPSRIQQQTLFEARRSVLEVYLAPPIEDYLLALVLATRDPSPYHPGLAEWVEFGASPRATIALDRCARARAWLDGRDFVTPEDVQDLAYDVLRHRVLMSYRAEAEGVDSDRFISELLAHLPVP